MSQLHDGGFSRITEFSPLFFFCDFSQTKCEEKYRSKNLMASPDTLNDQKIKTNAENTSLKNPHGHKSLL